jgi:SAM-dependent methyltransferase
MTMLRRQFALSMSALPALLAQTIDPSDQKYWNGKFNDPNTLFKRAPSRLLVDAIHDRKPGSAIDLGMGEGRNAIYLAQQGWQVTGVDLADAGVAQAKKRAAELHLNLTVVVDDLDHYDVGKNQWDLIAMFYVHAWYHGAKQMNVNRLKQALKSGGLIVMEGFAGPEKFMFQPNELLADFSGDLRILRYEDLQAEAEWAPGESSHIIRLIAEKSR